MGTVLNKEVINKDNTYDLDNRHSKDNRNNWDNRDNRDNGNCLIIRITKIIGIIQVVWMIYR